MHIQRSQVPCFCCCSENGSIASELLVEMLKIMDSLNLFDRSDGVPPFLLLDGHGSCSGLRFFNTSTTRAHNGMYALACPMAPPTGK